MTQLLTVLAVDDEAPALDELTYLLGKHPCIAEVFRAGDATSALRELNLRSIDAVFLDRDLQVLSTVENMKPWRLAGYWGANSVLELPAGECERLGVSAGDRLAWGQI